MSWCTLFRNMKKLHQFYTERFVHSSEVVDTVAEVLKQPLFIQEIHWMKDLGVCVQLQTSSIIEKKGVF